MSIAALILSIFLTASSVIIPPLEGSSAQQDWITLPSGLVVIHMEDVWVLYSAKIILCSGQVATRENEVIFTIEAEGSAPACYMIDPHPIGYYVGNMEGEYISLIERTGDK